MELVPVAYLSVLALIYPIYYIDYACLFFTSPASTQAFTFTSIASILFITLITFAYSPVILVCKYPVITYIMLAHSPVPLGLKYPVEYIDRMHIRMGIRML